VAVRSQGSAVGEGKTRKGGEKKRRGGLLNSGSWDVAAALSTTAAFRLGKKNAGRGESGEKVREGWSEPPGNKDNREGLQASVGPSFLTSS